MAHELRNWKLKFEDLGGYVRAIKQKVSRKVRPQKHPFLKGHKLDKGWAGKLAEGRDKVPKKVVRKTKAAVNKPVKKVSRRRSQ